MAKKKKKPILRSMSPDDPEFLERVRRMKEGGSPSQGPQPDPEPEKYRASVPTDAEHEEMKRVSVPKFDPSGSTDPRVRCPHCGESLGVRFLSPKQQYIQSMGEYGEGPSLKRVSECWPGLNYYRLREMKERDKARGQDWNALREEYQRKLMVSTADESIRKISQAQARVEADAVDVYSLMLGRFKLREKQRGQTDPLHFTNDKQAIDALDKLNKGLRRNVGLPESSYEVREKQQFVIEFMSAFATMIKQIESSPEKLELYAMRMEQIRLTTDPQYALLDSQTPQMNAQGPRMIDAEESGG